MSKQSVSPCETLAEQYQALLEVSEAIAVHRDLPSLFHDLVERLHHVVNFEYMRLLLHDPERDVMRLHTLETPNQSCDALGCQELPVAESPGGWVWQHQQPLLVSDVEKESRFPRDVFAGPGEFLRRVSQHVLASLYMYDPDNEVVSRHALDSPGGKGLLQEGFVGPIDSTPAGPAIRTGKPALFDEDDLKRLQSDVGRLLLEEGVKSGCCVPLKSHNRLLGTLNIASLHSGAFSQDDVDLLSQVANQIAIAVENALAYRQIEELKDKLNKEKLYLEDELRTEYNFEEIIEERPALKRILKQVETVAPTDSTVLIQGETGTGKELIARAIHSLSKRRERTFVRINCAAIPTGLLESEIFGHERGAFTGAIAQKVGRFELAHGGTLFLDEVGDVPLELQSKLLRVLQEQHFERLGSNRTIRVDVRLVAATNRDLALMVNDKQFP